MINGGRLRLLVAVKEHCRFITRQASRHPSPSKASPACAGTITVINPAIAHQVVGTQGLTLADMGSPTFSCLAASDLRVWRREGLVTVGACQPRWDRSAGKLLRRLRWVEGLVDPHLLRKPRRVRRLADEPLGMAAWAPSRTAARAVMTRSARP